MLPLGYTNTPIGKKLPHRGHRLRVPMDQLGRSLVQREFSYGSLVFVNSNHDISSSIALTIF